MNPHPTWDVLDSSKIQAFMDCPRQFFYRHVLGWEVDSTNVHLVFGEAIHQALEHIALHGFSDDIVAEAFQLFLSTYRQHFPDDLTDGLREPKTPNYALAVLAEYAHKYSSIDKGVEVLHTEVSGTVPIQLAKTGEKLLHFRIDQIRKKEGSIWGVDYKTTGNLSSNWIDQWYLSFQIGLYTHVLYCFYGPDAVKGMLIDAIEVKRATKALLAEGRLTGGVFDRVPVCRTPDMMQVWLWDANHWYDWVKFEFERLDGCKDADPFLMAFPRNTQNCTKYFGCAFRDFCMAWPNPLRKVDLMPPGFRLSWWDPREHVSASKKLVHIEQGEKI